MKYSFIRSLTLILITLLTTTTLFANDEVKRPKRRSQKVYTSPEEIQAQRDSLKQDSIISLLAIIDSPATVEPAKPRHNTPEQIDSVVAMWRATSTVEAYNRYFDDFLAASVRVDSIVLNDNLDSIYVARLEAMMSPVPLEYNYEVRRAIERFTAAAYATKMSYAYYYFPMIEEELMLAGIPIELRTLAIVESGLNPLAESRRGAKGIWQFMPSTGKEYGLEINSLVDERCNPRLATRAACRYLKSMYSQYGDWTLAIASYNCGPGNVNKAIIRSGGDPRK